MRQKTDFSVVENEGSGLGMSWPSGPLSSDCPVGWHTDDAPGGTEFETGVPDGSLPKTRECMWPFPRGLFMPPKARPRCFSVAKIAFLGRMCGSFVRKRTFGSKKSRDRP